MPKEKKKKKRKKKFSWIPESGIPLYGEILFLGVFGASLWQQNNLGVRTPLPANNQLEFDLQG